MLLKPKHRRFIKQLINVYKRVIRRELFYFANNSMVAIKLYDKGNFIRILNELVNMCGNSIKLFTILQNFEFLSFSAFQVSSLCDAAFY